MVHRVILRAGASQLDRYDVVLSTGPLRVTTSSSSILPPVRVTSIQYYPDEELSRTPGTHFPAGIHGLDVFL